MVINARKKGKTGKREESHRCIVREASLRKSQIRRERESHVVILGKSIL
jgi:hypothetical protein